MRTFIVFLVALLIGAAAGVYGSRIEPASGMIDQVLEPVPDEVRVPAIALEDGATHYSKDALASLDMQSCFDEVAAFPDGAERVSLQRDARPAPEDGAWTFPNLADHPGLVKVEQLTSTLGTSREHCGATRISEHWFMTASHCVINYQVMSAPVIDLILVTPGTDTYSESVQPVPVTGAVCHHDFGMDAWRFSNDIALLYVADVSLLEAVEIATLEPSDLELRRGDIATLYLSGWGSNGDFRFLQGGEVLPEYVGQSVIVTARIDGRGPDVGDSGSPLYTRLDGQPVVMGVLSNVRTRVPVELKSAAFVRVKGVRDWLETAMTLCEQNGRFVCGVAVPSAEPADAL